MSVAKLLPLASDRLFLAAVLLCTSALGLSAWYLFGRDKADLKPPSSRFTHVHCPTCGFEMLYTTGLEGTPCTECEAETPMVATIGSYREADAKSTRFWSRIFVLGVIAGVLIPSLILFASTRLRALKRAADEEEHRLVIWYCPFCQGKISYPISKAGSGVICSRCKTAFTLAPLEAAE